MGTTGKSISVTIPIPLVEDLQKGAEKVGLSRSRFISNLLLKWQEDQKGVVEGTLENTIEHSGTETPPNDCTNREDDGFCKSFETVCLANQQEAETCSDYSRRK